MLFTSQFIVSECLYIAFVILLVIYFLMMKLRLFLLFFAIMIGTGIDIHAQVFGYAFLFSFGEYLEVKWLGFKEGICLVS